MRVRLEFMRGDEMKYLSHLDLMRTFSRAFRRCGIPVNYSEGFNPHAKMVFGLPMQVGVTGDAECVDVEIADGYEPGKIPETINSCLPSGLKVAGSRESKSKDNVMAIITHASYEMRVGFNNCVNCNGRTGVECLRAATEAFTLPGPRLVDKSAGPASSGPASEGQVSGGVDIRGDTRSNNRGGKRHGAAKKQASLIDLAPLVQKLSARGDTLDIIVTAGSVNNVKPDLVLKSLNEIHRSLLKHDMLNNDSLDDNGPDCIFTKVSLHRHAVFVERGGILIKPIDGRICGETVVEANG